LRLEGKYPEARALLECLVAMMEAVHGSEHPQVAVALNQMAQVLCFLGNFYLARSTAERALKINETVLCPHHLDTAFSIFELGRVMLEQNDLGATQSMLDRALAILRQVVGDPAFVGAYLDHKRRARSPIATSECRHVRREVEFVGPSGARSRRLDGGPSIL
jgi:hypothetical protein